MEVGGHPKPAFDAIRSFPGSEVGSAARSRAKVLEDAERLIAVQRLCRDGGLRFAIRLGQLGEPQPGHGHFGKTDPRLRVRTSLGYLGAVRSM
jgi:hypothetical protein